MNIIEQIASKVKERLDERKLRISESEMAEKAQAARVPHSFREALLAPGVSIIAEVKFAAPFQGFLRPEVPAGRIAPIQVAQDYLSNGAVALSVLTESDYFHGSLSYLKMIRRELPQARLLMKDFIVDEYQIDEALVCGADAVLLILALIGENQARSLLKKCRSLGLTALVEVHDEEELAMAQRIGADLIGVNNRNLKTLETSLETSFRLAQWAQLNQLIVPGTCLVSESGIQLGTDIAELKKAGFSGFLIGKTFMKTSEPGRTLAQLLQDAERELSIRH